MKNNAKSPDLLVRADASSRIGVGHVMRCLALGQAWRELGGGVHFVCADLPESVRDRLFEEGFAVTGIHAQPGDERDANATREITQRTQPAWIVLDGYGFDSCYQQAVKADNTRLFMIDDYAHLDRYTPDLLLNQNLFVEETLYRDRASHTMLLLGSRFALLRREFTGRNGQSREIEPVARRILVTLGGSDPDNVTLHVIRALSLVDIPNLEAVVVVGGGNPNYERLLKAATDVPYQLRLERNTPHMPELMAWADVAISAGGSTCWELACMGLPHLILVLAENQRSIAEALAREDRDLNLGWFHECTEDRIAERVYALMTDQHRRAKLSRRGQKLIDGLGARRTAETLWNARSN